MPSSAAHTRFQSTRPRGARLKRSDVAMLKFAFQSTRPRGARPLMLVAGGFAMEFQSTRPRGARRDYNGNTTVIVRFQSTRPRGARLSAAGKGHGFAVSIHAPARGATLPAIYWAHRLVSIHAPARGATRSHHRSPRWSAVSIHAPARGATMQVAGLLINVWFQSTRPRGARRSVAATHDRVAVSIHAPARGATRMRNLGSAVGRCFNPRARAGRDGDTAAIAASCNSFQSTRPRGARPTAAPCCEGVRWVSIHAPARGATRLIASSMTRAGCFNPRARAGRDATAFEPLT